MPEYVWVYDNRQDFEYISYNAKREVTLEFKYFEYLLRDGWFQNPVHRDAVMEWSEYSKILNMPGFCICKRYTTFSICLNMAK